MFTSAADKRLLPLDVVFIWFKTVIFTPTVYQEAESSCQGGKHRVPRQVNQGSC